MNHPHHELEADGSPNAYIRHSEAETFQHYAAIIRRLRGDGGCPWDRKQTLRSLRRFVVEESFEVVAAINELEHEEHDNIDPSTKSESSANLAGHAAVADELGDVLLVSLLLADALERVSGVSLEDILAENGRKLIRRHPHVFGSGNATTAEEVVVNWNQIKKDQEGRSSSVVDVSRGLPPLERAFEMQKKASAVGFDWDTVEPSLSKLKEEIAELEQRIVEVKMRSEPLKDDSTIEEELGDVLFSAVNVSRHLKTDPSIALAHTNEKFFSRFHYIEEQVTARGQDLQHVGLETLDALWNKAKAHTKPL